MTNPDPYRCRYPIEVANQIMRDIVEELAAGGGWHRLKLIGPKGTPLPVMRAKRKYVTERLMKAAYDLGLRVESCTDPETNRRYVRVVETAPNDPAGSPDSSPTGLAGRGRHAERGSDGSAGLSAANPDISACQPVFAPVFACDEERPMTASAP